jgi:hypothetical protein
LIYDISVDGKPRTDVSGGTALAVITALIAAFVSAEITGLLNATGNFRRGVFTGAIVRSLADTAGNCE